jgi:hypothetical protein
MFIMTTILETARRHLDHSGCVRCWGRIFCRGRCRRFHRRARQNWRCRTGEPQWTDQNQTNLAGEQPNFRRWIGTPGRVDFAPRLGPGRDQHHRRRAGSLQTTDQPQRIRPWWNGRHGRGVSTTQRYEAVRRLAGLHRLHDLDLSKTVTTHSGHRPFVPIAAKPCASRSSNRIIGNHGQLPAAAKNRRPNSTPNRPGRLTQHMSEQLCRDCRSGSRAPCSRSDTIGA